MHAWCADKGFVVAFSGHAAWAMPGVLVNHPRLTWSLFWRVSEFVYK
jgi:hypothetical protein